MKHEFLKGDDNIAKRSDIRTKISDAKWQGHRFTCKFCGVVKRCSLYQVNSKHFCSRICKGKFMSTQRGSNSPNWRGGIIQDGDGYKHVYAPSHPMSNKKGYLREHRLVVSEKTGRLLNNEDIVHHRNGNKSDNHNSNLLITNRSKHGTIHNVERLRNQQGQYS